MNEPPPDDYEDDIIREIRAYREERAARFNYDIWAMARDTQAQEAVERANGRVFLDPPPRPHAPARVTVLADDVAAAFPDDAAVNAALREYLRTRAPEPAQASAD